jgi:hypothetical protein
VPEPGRSGGAGRPGPAGSAPPEAIAGADADLRREGAALADALEAALPGWVQRSVTGILTAWGGPVPDDIERRVAAAAGAAVDDVVPAVRRLAATDVDAQRGNPLDVLRRAARHPSAVLRDVGVPGVVRDDFDVAHFPDDEYGLVPMAFADVHPSLHEPGLRWGAAKARAHLLRHRRPAG